MNGWSEDDDKVAQQLMLLNNDAEWESLRVAWGGVDGTRKIEGGLFGGGGGCDFIGDIKGLINGIETPVVAAPSSCELLIP